MGISITKRPDRTTILSGKTARWLAVNGEYPVVFEFIRQDYKQIIYERTSSGKLALVIPTVDLTGEIQVGDFIYFHSVLYDKGTGEVKSVAITGSGNTRLTVDYLLEGTWTNDFNSENYVNLLSSRDDYRVEIKVVDSITRAFNSAEYRPYSDGRIEFDVSSFVRLPLSIDNDYTSINKSREDISKKFYLEFIEKWGATENETTDIVNYYAVSGAMQLQETHAPNLLSFTAFGRFDLPEEEKAKFLTDFEKPNYWVGYPFNLHYIVENNDAFPAYQRIEEGYNNLGGSEGLNGVSIPNPDYNYLNAITLDGNYSEDVCELEVWIDSGLVPTNSCESISANDWKYDDFKLNGSYIAGVFMSPNTPASIIASIDSYPDGGLYQDDVLVSNLVYSAVRGYYELLVGDDQVLLQGTIEARILNVPVTTTSGDSCTPNYVQTVSAKDELNDLPVASNVLLNASSFDVGEDVTVSYIYSDPDGDLENVAGTEVQIYRFDNESDCQNFANGTLIFTELGESLPLDLPANLGGQGGSYTIASTDAGKWIKARVTPSALTGATPGLSAYSGCQEIEAPAVATYTHNKQTSHELTIFVSSGESATIKWGDSTEQAVIGSATAQTFSKTYGSAGTNTVQVFGDPEHILELSAVNQGVLTLDISNTTHLREVDFKTNSGLTSFIAPTSQIGNVTVYDFEDCNLTGNVSITDLPLSGAILEFQSNANMTGLDLTGCTGTILLIRGDRCDITGTMTIPSGLAMGGTGNKEIYFYSNPNMTAFDMSNLSGDLKTLHLYSSGLTGVLNMGSVNFVNGDIKCDANTGLTGWNISSCTGDLYIFNFNGCGLSGAQTISLPFDPVLACQIYFVNTSASSWTITLTAATGNFSALRFNNSGLSGNLVFPTITTSGATAIFTANNCPNLTGIDLSSVSGDMQFFDVGTCASLTGALDLTGFTWQNNSWFLVDGTDITSIDHSGTSGGDFDYYDISWSSVSGTLTLGAFSFDPDSTLSFRGVSGITAVDFSLCSGEIRKLYMDRCSISGVIDISMFNFDTVNAEILCYNNTGLTGLSFSASASGNLTSFQAYGTSIVRQTNDFGNITIDSTCNFEFFDCNLSASDVDAWWNLLDTLDPGTGATGSLEGGGNNASPTATSDSARTNLISAGYSLIT